MGEKKALRRNPRIEALRLIAIAGIAVFHKTKKESCETPLFLFIGPPSRAWTTSPANSRLCS